MKKIVLLARVLWLLSTALSSCVVGLLELQMVYALPYTGIDIDTAYNMITNGSYPNLIVLDVRSQDEHDSGHIYSAVWIPHTELEARIGELAGHENHEIIVYCGSGVRSANASEILDSHNFTKVYNMLGGILEWQSADYPVWNATVHNVNTTFNYDTIQAAINAPQTLDGHTILVDAGTYYEHVVVKKSISLIGENRSTTVIDGNGTGNVIDITAHHISVTVTGFTIRNGKNGTIIRRADHNIISGNIVTNNQHGIHLFATCPCNPARENTIRNNIIKNNSIGINLKLSTDNAIYHNNFINNTQQVNIQTSGYANFWDDGYPSGGNYWSDYEERYPDAEELDDSGIWNTPYVIDEDNQDNYPLMYPWGAPPPPSYILTIYCSPTGVTFTVDDVSHTTPWSEIYDEDTSVNLEIPETHTVGEARYYWSQWSDGNTSRTRTVIMNTNITLTAYYTGPYYQHTVTSSPITGIPFTINGAPQTTPYTEWLLEDSYTLEMPETHDGYKWSHWQEDGDTNRTKTVTVDTNITLTGVFTPVPPIATVDIDPNTLNLKSRGKWITCYIELPEGYDVSDVNRATILLNCTIPVDQFWVDKPLESVIGDYDNDTISDLMVKFDRQALIECLKTKGITGVEVTLTITGEANGISFEVTDTIKVICQ